MIYSEFLRIMTKLKKQLHFEITDRGKGRGFYIQWSGGVVDGVWTECENRTVEEVE